MTIIDCLFYAFDSLSSDVVLESTAKLAVVWQLFEQNHFYLQVHKG